MHAKEKSPLPKDVSGHQQNNTDFHACSWNAGLHKKEEVGLDIQACKSFFRSIWEGIEARV